MKVNPILCRQLALDYCCSEEDILDIKNHFSIHQRLDGRRKYKEEEACFLKIASVNAKLLFCGDERILSWCQEQYASHGGEWFFEYPNLKKLDDRLHQEGYEIHMVHPFYIGETISNVDTNGWTIQWYDQKAIEFFRGDERFDEAFAFDKETPDVLGVAAIKNGEILGMAGASCDSETMWQIGINVDLKVQSLGVGTMLVALLKNAILKEGKLPFYGTSMSHLASQRVAFGAGFMPVWVELSTSRIK